MTETIFGKNVCDLYFFIFLSSTNMEGAGFMTYMANQEVIRMFKFHFWGTVMLSIFIWGHWLQHISSKGDDMSV